jgi:hypothetical protein
VTVPLCYFDQMYADDDPWGFADRGTSDASAA